MAKQDDRRVRKAGAVRADLASHLRRSLARADNAGILQAMPQFAADTEIPDPLRDLLARLDEAEQRA